MTNNTDPQYPNQDNIPTTPIAPEDIAVSAETTENQAAEAHEGDSAASDAHAADSSLDAEADTPTPFWKRKWVMITAPIVAGVLLLGVGGSVGYAAGADNDHGSHHDQVAEDGDRWQGGQGRHDRDHGHGPEGGRGFENQRGFDDLRGTESSPNLENGEDQGTDSETDRSTTPSA